MRIGELGKDGRRVWGWRLELGARRFELGELGAAGQGKRLENGNARPQGRIMEEDRIKVVGWETGKLVILGDRRILLVLGLAEGGILYDLRGIWEIADGDACLCWVQAGALEARAL